MVFPIERWFHNFQWYVLTVGIWLYFVYFLNRLLTVPLMFGRRKKQLIGAGLILASGIVTLLLSQVQLYDPKPSVFDVGITRILPQVNQYQQAIWSLYVIVEAFSFAVGLLSQANRQRAQRRAVEAERDKAEIELYKAQIKPHFMFNTLNSLYGLFLTQSPKALPSLEAFISMTRYIHVSSLRNLVPLGEEADYIRRFVDLQRLRLNDKTEVNLDIDIENPGLTGPPMLLVTFVENCFKHGVSPVEKCRIDISLHEHDGHFEFTTVNHIFPVKRIGEHLGIENCRKRLALLFPDRHELTIERDENDFKVKLIIELK